MRWWCLESLLKQGVQLLDDFHGFSSGIFFGDFK
jgi:hypothetical protein